MLLMLRTPLARAPHVDLKPRIEDSQRSPLARAPYVVFFDLKPKTATCRYICAVCMHEKEPQEPPEHTSQHVKSQNFLGVCPQTPLTQAILWGPTFCICPGPPNPLSGPGGHQLCRVEWLLDNELHNRTPQAGVCSQNSFGAMGPQCP